MRKETTSMKLICKHVSESSVCQDDVVLCVRARERVRGRARERRNDAWPKIAIVEFTNTQYYKICRFENEEAEKNKNNSKTEHTLTTHTHTSAFTHLLERTHAHIHVCVCVQVWATAALDWFFVRSSLYILLFIHLNSCSHYLLTLTFQLNIKNRNEQIFISRIVAAISIARAWIRHWFCECVSIDSQRMRGEQEGGGEERKQHLVQILQTINKILHPNREFVQFLN